MSNLPRRVRSEHPQTLPVFPPADLGEVAHERAVAYARRCGELRWAVRELLDVIDRAGVELGGSDRVSVEYVRALLDEPSPSDSRR